ncbi:hypothetical protein [Pedobacter aquatilis]|uniref:hypothetical protein n=1 Tax=Pedobacter aquatilis TaxID=351343 RepID=UPI00292F468C|nr:hypothetical protein [Pedobacter aquatilis]
MDRVPPPPSPGGCLIGGIMYTGYIRTIYMGRTGTAPNETVTGYRYQYDSAGPRQNCYVGRTNFIGPDPNATGNTPIADIGCGFSPNYNPNTTSTSVFTIVACPIDDYTPWLILPIGIFGFYYMRKGSFTG